MEKEILIIEDNDDDVLMIKRGFKKGKIGNNLHCVSNGKEAYEYLEGMQSSDIQLILLDLNMEIMNGFDFLKKRLEMPEIKKIPVVVLTSSSRLEDIENAYNLGANSYVEKPLNPLTFIDAMLKIENFWVYLARRPE